MEGDRLPLYQGAVVVKANRAPGGPELAEVSQPVNTTRPLINITDEGNFKVIKNRDNHIKKFC